jgi:hypothetical protein
VNDSSICDGGYSCRATEHLHGCYSDDPCRHIDEIRRGVEAAELVLADDARRGPVA